MPSALSYTATSRQLVACTAALWALPAAPWVQAHPRPAVWGAPHTRSERFCWSVSTYPQPACLRGVRPADACSPGVSLHPPIHGGHVRGWYTRQLWRAPPRAQHGRCCSSQPCPSCCCSLCGLHTHKRVSQPCDVWPCDYHVHPTPHAPHHTCSPTLRPDTPHSHATHLFRAACAFPTCRACVWFHPQFPDPRRTPSSRWSTAPRSTFSGPHLCRMAVAR